MQHKSPFRDKVRIIVFDNNFILVMKLSRKQSPESVHTPSIISKDHRANEGREGGRGGELAVAFCACVTLF